jgi:chromosomal replication initiator protein
MHAQPHRPASIRSIQLEVCDRHNISLQDMLSASRKQVFVRPRHEAIQLARQKTNASLPQIARAFNRKNHTTILHAVRKGAANG